MRVVRIPHSSWLAVLAIAAASSAAHAQGTARSLSIDPSIRASGMGGASNAVFWDDGTNSWGNPAFLGYQHGLGYDWGNTKLAPGLAGDIHFSSNVLKLGGGGLGVAFSGEPFGVGGMHLSYGNSQGTDPSGNPTGTFESFEQVDAWSLGVSVVRAAEAIAVRAGHDPDEWSRYGDVSFGMTAKHLDMSLAPLVEATTDAHDRGVLVRLSPSEFFPNVRDVFGVDLSYGWSQLNYDADPVVFINEDQQDEVSEHERRGFAGRIRLDWPDMSHQVGGPEWVWQGFHPLFSIGIADDHSRIGTSMSRYETDGSGWEMTIANVFSLRGGHFEDRLGAIDGNTKGWGVGLPVGHFGGVRYDFAKFPQAQDSGLPNLERHAVSAWVDVIRVWRVARS